MLDPRRRSSDIHRRAREEQQEFDYVVKCNCCHGLDAGDRAAAANRGRESRDRVLGAWPLRCGCARPGRSVADDSIRGRGIAPAPMDRTAPYSPKRKHGLVVVGR